MPHFKEKAPEMKNSFRSFFAFSLITASLFWVPGLSFCSTWLTYYGDKYHHEISSTVQTLDDGWIMAGHTMSPDSGNQVRVVRVDPMGKIRWQKIYANAQGETYRVKSVDRTSEGGYVLAGSAMTCHETEPLCQGYAWLALLDQEGAFLWQKGFKDTGGYANFFSAVQTADDGGFIAAGGGGTTGMVSAGSRFWILKADEDGQVQWQFMFDHENITDSYANAIQQTTDGGYIVAGTLFSGVTNWSEGYDIWVLKLTRHGQVEWHNQYRSPGGYDIAWSVIQPPDGGYVVAGQTENLSGYGTDGLVMKLDPHGRIEWQKNYETGFGDAIHDIALTRDNGYVIGGLYQGGGIAAGLDRNGIVTWQKKYPGNALVFAEQSSGGFVMAASGSNTRDGIDANDFLLMKTDLSGNITNCLPLDSPVTIQVQFAGFKAISFDITITSPELLQISTQSIPTDTNIIPMDGCPCRLLTGDTNQDGSVDVGDAVTALKAMTGTSLWTNTGCPESNADVNDDQKIGMADIFYMLRQ